jgi:hypothetical protein
MEKLSDDNTAKKEMEDRTIESDPYYSLKSSSITLKKASDDYLKSLGDLLEKKFSEKWQDDVNKIENLKKMAKNLELSIKLLDLFEKLDKYDSSIENDLKNKIESFEIIRIERDIEKETTENQTEYDNIITFAFRNKEYTFKDEKYSFPMYDEDGYAWKLILFENNETQIFMQTYFFSPPEKSYYDGDWNPSPDGVDAFIPGEWITDILELYEKLVALLKERKLKENYKYKSKKIEKQKKDFGLK